MARPEFDLGDPVAFIRGGFPIEGTVVKVVRARRHILVTGPDGDRRVFVERAEYCSQPEEADHGHE